MLFWYGWVVVRKPPKPWLVAAALGGGLSGHPICGPVTFVPQSPIPAILGNATVSPLIGCVPGYERDVTSRSKHGFPWWLTVSHQTFTGQGNGPRCTLATRFVGFVHVLAAEVVPR